MTPLRQKMIDVMLVRGMSPKTHRSYLNAVTALSQYYQRSPDQISGEELQAYFLYLVKERQLSPATCRLALNAFRFLYRHVLGRDDFGLTLSVPSREQRIPDLLMRSEVVGLQISHIDSERHLLRIEQGKGRKDRAVILSPSLLQLLRQYWQLLKPPQWLFPGRNPDAPMSIDTAQNVFSRAKEQAGINKIGGIHSLRHAYATHQLEDGMPIHQLQRLLGHQNIQSTLRYTHWVPGHQEGQTGSDLLAQLEQPS